MTNLMLTFRTPAARARPRSTPRCTTRGPRPASCRSKARVVELPVDYGGELRPALADVVAHTGLSVDEIVAAAQRAALHRSMRSAAIRATAISAAWTRASPRRAARCRCSGIARRRGVDRRRADRRLGIGGTERLEHDRHTSMSFFDPARENPPAMLAARRHDPLSRREDRPMIEILSSAALATVQDQGREGYLRYGVGTSGAMDRAGARGRQPDARQSRRRGRHRDSDVPVPRALLRRLAFAMTGADCSARLGERPVLPWWTVQAKTGRRADDRRAGQRQRGVTCSLAGGVDVPVVLGSRSTQLRGAVRRLSTGVQLRRAMCCSGGCRRAVETQCTQPASARAAASRCRCR